MSRKAVIVGFDDYKHAKKLEGCVHDAKEIARLLEWHEHTDDKQRNFDITLLTSGTHNYNREYVRDKIETLFRDDRDVSLFYFSGHGYFENTGGYLITPESERGDQGISMTEIMLMANASPATNRIIILDCCFAGGFGRNILNEKLITISEGVTILAASTKDQFAKIKDKSGLFTSLLVHALEGGAANLLGEVSAGNIYSYVDRAIGERGQRPLYITSVKRYVNLKSIPAPIKRNELREITKLFTNPDMEFELDSSFEPKSKNPDPKNVEKFAILQKYNRVNLVVPVGVTHMYDAATEGKSCKLTALGKSYWYMVENNII